MPPDCVTLGSSLNSPSLRLLICKISTMIVSSIVFSTVVQMKLMYIKLFSGDWHIYLFSICLVLVVRSCGTFFSVMKRRPCFPIEFLLSSLLFHCRLFLFLASNIFCLKQPWCKKKKRQPQSWGKEPLYPLFLLQQLKTPSVHQGPPCDTAWNPLGSSHTRLFLGLCVLVSFSSYTCGPGLRVQVLKSDLKLWTNI